MLSVDEMSGHRDFYNSSNKILKELAEALDGEDNFLLVDSILRSIDAAEIASFLRLANDGQVNKLLDVIKNNFDPKILIHLDVDLILMIVEKFGTELSAKIMKKLGFDDIVYVIGDLSQSMQNSIIGYFPNNVQRIIHELLSYPEDSVGRLVHKDLIAVLGTWNVGEVMEFLRNYKGVSQKFSQLFVLDENHRPIGSISASKVLSSNKDIVISAIMDRDIKFVKADFDQKEVAYIFRRYELTDMLIVDDNQRVIGSISINDVLDIVEEYAEEDILKFGGISTESDIHTKLAESIKSRLPWLLINLCLATASSSVIRMFENTISQAIILASLVTIISSSGGSASMQTVIIITRAISRKEITELNLLRVIIKEILTGLINGLLISALSISILTIFITTWKIAFLFGFSLTLVFVISAFMGTVIPLFINMIKIDPAVASPTIVATLTDLISFFIFLSIASHFFTI